MSKTALKEKIDELMDRYEEEMEMTFADLVNELSNVADDSENSDLKDIIGKYRAEEHENFTVWGMRDDMEDAMDAFLDNISTLTDSISS